MISQDTLKDLEPILFTLNHPSSCQNDLYVFANHIFNPIVTVALTALAVGAYCNPFATLGFLSGFICSPVSQNALISRSIEIMKKTNEDSQTQITNIIIALPISVVDGVVKLWKVLPSSGKIALKTVGLVSITACITFSFFYSAYHLYALSGMALGLVTRRFLIPESSSEKMKELRLACKVVVEDYLKNTNEISSSSKQKIANQKCCAKILKMLSAFLNSNFKQ